MEANMEKVTNVAVLIDAENVGAQNAKQIFDEASNYGNVMVKRIFADWSKTSVRAWKEEVNRYSMTAVQQFEVQARKNTTDICLIIQALLIPRRRPVRMAGMEEGTTILQMVFMVGIR